MTFQRITVDPKVCGGKPVIGGLRFRVSRLLGLLTSGETRESRGWKGVQERSSEPS